MLKTNENETWIRIRIHTKKLHNFRSTKNLGRFLKTDRRTIEPIHEFKRDRFDNEKQWQTQRDLFWIRETGRIFPNFVGKWRRVVGIDGVVSIFLRRRVCDPLALVGFHRQIYSWGTALEFSPRRSSSPRLHPLRLHRFRWDEPNRIDQSCCPIRRPSLFYFVLRREKKEQRISINIYLKAS